MFFYIENKNLKVYIQESDNHILNKWKVLTICYWSLPPFKIDYELTIEKFRISKNGYNWYYKNKLHNSMNCFN